MTSPKSDLFPDGQILQQLFPNSAAVPTTILSQTFDTCTFIAHVSDTPELIVRLEVVTANVYRLRTLLALHQIASIAIPHLVPKAERAGVAQTEGGVAVEFLITAFVPNSVTLESVWDNLAYNEQSEIIREVVGATQTLGTISRADKHVQNVLQGSGFILDDSDASVHPPLALGALGGPNIGYAKDAADLLRLIVNANTPAGKLPSSTLHRNPQDNTLSIVSAYRELGHMELSAEDLARPSIIFCHADLEPRNILVQPCSPPRSYKVVAIIDWEMAGFYPLGYEYIAKDSFLGSSNLSFPWYSLFKQEYLLRANNLHECGQFMQAVDIILRSSEKALLDRQNVGALVREKWIAREQLERLAGNPLGWTRKATDTTVPKYTKEDNDKLVEDVLRELGRI